MHTTIDRAESLRAYPTLSAAARMIGIAPSTLTRRADCEPLHRGARDQVLPPSEVLRLAAIYRKRSLNEVAADLIDAAAEHGAEDAQRVEDAVEAFFAGRSHKDSAEAFLDEAKRHLPAALYAEVEKTVRRGQGRRPAPITGQVPPRPGKAVTKPRPASPRKPSGKRSLPKVRS